MSAKQPHVLIIDDNADILVMLSAMLKFKGYLVSIKDTIENIETEIEHVSPDLILMDMLLSGANGCEICKSLKSNHAFSHIPVVMISAHPQAQAECLKAGADYFLGKPFEMNDLIKLVSGILPQSK